MHLQTATHKQNKPGKNIGTYRAIPESEWSQKYLPCNSGQTAKVTEELPKTSFILPQKVKALALVVKDERKQERKEYKSSHENT